MQSLEDRILLELVTLTVALVTCPVLWSPHCTVLLHCGVDHCTVPFVTRTGVLITTLSCPSPEVCVGHEKCRLWAECGCRAAMKNGWCSMVDGSSSHGSALKSRYWFFLEASYVSCWFRWDCCVGCCFRSDCSLVLRVAISYPLSASWAWSNGKLVLLGTVLID
jgi:hypothetical protein